MRRPMVMRLARAKAKRAAVARVMGGGPGALLARAAMKRVGKPMLRARFARLRP
jgi:hypothetical protein